MDMDIKPFLHKHFLLFDFYENREATCDKCHKEIFLDWAFNCERCNFWLHDSCAEQQLPPQISHPAHSQHLLTRSRIHHLNSTFVCDICFSLCKGHEYACHDCDFRVDVLCASESSRKTLIWEKECQRSDDKNKNFEHFSHECKLTLFNYRKVEKDEYSCSWCGKFLSGLCYGCYSCKFFLHQSCLLKIPFRIFQHPFHPSHPLHILSIKNCNSRRCNACNDDLTRDAYVCLKCEFSIHVLCARLQPTLKHDVHDHSLTYIPMTITSIDISYQCSMCHEDIPTKIDRKFFPLTNTVIGNFYRCVQCDMNFHLKCVPIPLMITHKYHRHDLTFTESFIEDDCGEYYCDICEEERNSKHPIYYCEECIYIAHIHCALNKVDSKAVVPRRTRQEETKKSDAEFQTDHLEIEVFFHRHPLCFYEVDEEDELMYCNACNFEISSQGYACESCEYYYLHKTCTQLPYEMLHPLHPQHSLNFFASTSEMFTCHECRYYSLNGFGYVCYQCNFKLDVKCATNFSTTPGNEHQRLKQMGRLSKRCPFNQVHMLEFMIRSVFDFWEISTTLLCSLCLLPLMGPIYECKVCDYRIHESCLEFPWEIQVPVHPAHPLRPALGPPGSNCQVCGYRIPLTRNVFYGCQQCENVNLHLPCANSLNRAIIIKGSRSHVHYLFYHGAKTQKVLSNIKADFSTCDECGGSLSRMAFYRCLICRINVHLKCVPIPHFIKSKCHIHPFILKYCFVEDDSGEHYCDVCEEERHPEHHVYYCEECGFVSHIECTLKQVEESTLAGLAKKGKLRELRVETYSNLELDLEKIESSPKQQFSAEDWVLESPREEQSDEEKKEETTKEQQIDEANEVLPCSLKVASAAKLRKEKKFKTVTEVEDEILRRVNTRRGKKQKSNKKKIKIFSNGKISNQSLSDGDCQNRNCLIGLEAEEG